MGVDAWLSEGDAPEADWGAHVLRLALRGGLGHGGGGLLFDLPALTTPYGCRSETCRPGRRAKAARSCCADLDVVVDAATRAAIQAHVEALRPYAAPASGTIDDPFAGDTLRRPGRRCVFSSPSEGGRLACALHLWEDAHNKPRGTLKPVPCRLFPLAVIDLGEGRRLLTAVHRATWRSLASRRPSAFPCLGEGAPIYVAERETITALFGERAWTRLDRAAQPSVS